ncbi:MAG: hypothetical protein WC058_03760 [Phycisphaeraceae bacterium]
MHPPHTPALSRSTYVLIPFFRRCQHRKSQRQGAPTSRWVRSLGRKDQIVEYIKPAKRPTWISAEEYAALPASITVRELEYRITRPGLRTRIVTAVTNRA